MEILQKDDGLNGQFYIEIDLQIQAKMSYIWRGNDRIIIDHTEVSEFLRGKNAGKQMVTKAVEFARKKNIKIVPLCPFAKRVLTKSPDFSDVL
jgi:uncharacterized protein